MASASDLSAFPQESVSEESGAYFRDVEVLGGIR